MLNLHGVINFLEYLLYSIFPSIVFTGIIFIGFLAVKVIFYIMLTLFTSKSDSEEDEFFAYTIDNGPDS